jgi:DNA-binding IclR family transcriptional regulator|tara:strand:- start:109 stop:894 length:786 start_codon:yes stop_codon:yes gene_type:complete
MPIDDEPAKDRQFVTALSRGLAILKCFDGQHRQLGVSDLARRVGLPQPTVWRLCHTLIKEGYLVQTDRNDKLRPGVAVLALGFAALTSTPLAELAFDAMNSIAEKHEGAVSLAVADNADMIYIQRCQGSKIILSSLTTGSRVPMLTSAVGWAYLAGLPPERRKQALKICRDANPKQYPEVIGLFEKALAFYEKNGHLESHGILHPQINAVGAPVRSHDGERVFGLSAGGISSLFDATRLQAAAEDIRNLASELSQIVSAQR